MAVVVFIAALLAPVAPAGASVPGIQGGTLVTTPGVWPWSVALFIDGAAGGCSGELIGPTTVLTAAHCVQGDTSIDVTHDRNVAADWTANTRPADSVAATSWTYDYQYDGVNPTDAHDFGIVTLPAPIPGTSHLPLVQPGQAGPYETGSQFNGLEAGYGVTSYNGVDFGVLNQIELPGSYCSVASSCSSSESYLAVGSSQSGAACEGDSGSAFLVSLPGTTLPVSTDPTVGNGDWAILGVLHGTPSQDSCGPNTFETVADDAAWLLPYETPAVFVAPSIGGTPSISDTLQCNPGTWSTTVTPTYQWETVGTGSPVAIAGATEATYTPVGADVGTQIECEVEATAAGFGHTGGATSAPVTILAAPTTVTYTGATSGEYGQPVTLSATLTSTASGSGISGQQLSLSFGAEQCTATTGASGDGSCQVSPIDLPAGSPYTITASFAAMGAYDGSSDMSQSFTVTPRPTALAYTGATSGKYGQPVTLSATLTDVGSGSGISGQTVSIAFGAEQCTATTSASGAGSCQVTPTDLPAGSPYTIAAGFAATGPYSASSDTSQSFAVQQAGTTTALASAANPSTIGQPVTYTATVARTVAGSGSPGGTVSFSEGGSPIGGCAQVTLTGGRATCQVTYQTTAGSPHQILVSYSGDQDFNQSSDSLSQTVGPVPTTLVAARAKFGLLSVTFSGTLTREETGATLAGRTISFSVLGHAVCQATTNASGVGSCTVAPALVITLGPSSYTARFAGDTNDQASSATGQLTSGLTIDAATLARASSGRHSPAIERATLTCGGIVYAVGTGRVQRDLMWLEVKLLHRVEPGRYTLTLTLANHGHNERTITLR